MGNVLEKLHTVTPLTNADMFSIMVMGFMIGVFISDGCHALIEFIVKKHKEKKYE